jgi:twitching motility protein PilT
VKPIDEMLRSLAEPGATEFAVVSERLPCVKRDGAFQPVDDVAPSTDAILQMLMSVGGSRYVDDLGPRPVQWSTRVEGLGTIGISAMMRDDLVQARFVLQKRDERAPVASPRAAGDVVPAVVGLRGGARGLTPPPPPIEASARARISGEPPHESDLARRRPAVRHESDATIPGDAPIELDPRPSPLEPRAPYARELSLDTEDEARAAPASSVPITREPRSRFGAEVESPPVSARAAHAHPPVPPHTTSPTRRELPHVGHVVHAPVAPTPAPRRFDSPPQVEAPPPATRLAGAASVRELAELLAMARAANASDLHVIALRPPLLRIAGELTPRGTPLDAAFMERVVHGIVPPRLIAPLEQDGSCDFALAEPSGARCRVNVTRQRTGYKVCIRLVPAVIPTLESLGLPDAIARATHHHQGLILVTGPTGHGKTSTLAAIVDLINTETTRHVITVEDPVEYLHPRKRAMMSQREVGTHTRTFAAALKGSLREDPDVIVVGELRDTETVRMALSASETGHLVVGTMNTPSAAKTIDRVIDLFPPSDQAQVRMTLAGGLRLVVSQRLVPNAKQNGLVAAVEMLPGSISLWSLIRDNKTFQIPSLQQRGKALGIVRLDDSLADLVKSGQTTLEIARAYAESPDELEANVLGKRPQVRAPEPPKPPVDVGGLLGKAGSLFRKGGS